MDHVAALHRSHLVLAQPKADTPSASPRSLPVSASRPRVSRSSVSAGAGYDTSFGGGVRLGWTWQASQNLKVGATYQSRLWMTKFDKYAGLFAERGGFDIPSNYALGFAYKIDSSRSPGPSTSSVSTTAK
jgi:long-subunit fatty acid transport protein